MQTLTCQMMATRATKTVRQAERLEPKAPTDTSEECHVKQTLFFPETSLLR